ncbi:hypothetical protein [Solicola sp. PLA-1-18]|uniref:hypothetical protein n=1 Tax=Solicola sp. PLA-1-18 TaxID=3380532 RepID=UPI003B7F57AC
MTARRAALAAVTLAVLGTAACSGEAAPSVDLPSGPTASATSEADAGGGGDFEPTIPTGSVPPTEGLPTQARAELRGAGDLDPAVLAAWTAFEEARAESLRAHEATPELRRVATSEAVQQITARGATDARDGLTVGLRPLGRLESTSESGATVRLTVCQWAPSTGFFVEATGEASEGADPGWVEVLTVLRRSGETWRVTESGRTGQTCPGGSP